MPRIILLGHRKPFESEPTLSISSEQNAVPVRRDLLPPGGSTSTPSDRSLEKRRLRKFYVLNVIRENPSLSRAEIAKTSGFNLPSVSSLVDELLEDGLVSEDKARAVVRGRRPIPVNLVENAASALGIDVGKFTSTALLTNLVGEPIGSIDEPTPELLTPQDFAKWVSALVEKLVARHKEKMPSLCGIGIALPGLVASSTTEDSTSASDAGTLPYSEAIIFAIRRALERFGVPVLADNDARVMVPASQWFNASNCKYRHFAILNVGIGLGLGLSVNGQVMQGARGFAGEIGHIPLGRPGVPCYCGRSGCLENIASGAGLMALAREKELDVPNVEELAALARKGDKKARAIFSEFADGLGRGVATVINLFDPEAVFIAGRVSGASDVFLADMKKSMEVHSLPDVVKGVELIVVAPDKNLSSLGAVAMVLHRIFYSSNVSYEEVI